MSGTSFSFVISGKGAKKKKGCCRCLRKFFADIKRAKRLKKNNNGK